MDASFGRPNQLKTAVFAAFSAFGCRTLRLTMRLHRAASHLYAVASRLHGVASGLYGVVTDLHRLATRLYGHASGLQRRTKRVAHT